MICSNLLPGNRNWTAQEPNKKMMCNNNYIKEGSFEARGNNPVQTISITNIAVAKQIVIGFIANGNANAFRYANDISLLKIPEVIIKSPK